MLVRLLGNLELVAEGRPLPLGGPRQQTVLAMLALSVNSVTSVDLLIEAVWGEQPPPTARGQIQVCISTLRKLFAEAGQPEAIRTYGPGYLLELTPDEVDSFRFAAEVAAAKVHADAGRTAEGVRSLRAALALWRGEALAGIQSELVRRAAAALDAKRLAAVEERIRLELRLGWHEELTAELQALVAEHPLRERLHEFLMLSLYRSGRQAEALGVYRQARATLIEEVGIEPGQELQQLELAILNRDPALGSPVVRAGAQAPEAPPPPADPPPAPPTRPVPRQLPAGTGNFAGRVTELDRLNALVADDRPEAGGSVVITAIAGTAGVGKTSLAVHWAHQVSHRFPDGQLYVNLRGFDPYRAAMKAGEAIRSFLDAFGVPSQAIPTTLEAQEGMYRSLLAGRRVLVLLDNARDTDQVNHLLPGSPSCLVVVTSRNRLSGLVAAGAASMTVDLLTVPEARQLLASRIGEERVTAEPEAVDEIIAACARLPLALAIVAARAAAHRQFTLALLAGELRQTRGGLDAFLGENAATDARAVLSWSYQILSEDAARLFRLLGLLPGPDVTAPAAASLAGIPVTQARRLLTELSAANLLAEHTLGRFAFHDLLRAYAAEQVQTVESHDERQAALRRVLDHYLHTTHAADRRLYPYRFRISIEPLAAGATITELSGAEAALAWFTDEHAVLLAAIDKALATGFSVHASQLAQTFTAFLNYQGHWNDWASSQHIALEAYRRLGDRSGQALAHRLLNLAYMQQGRLDQADSHARQALELFEEIGDQPGQTRIHLDLGRLSERQGRFQQALEHAEEALAVARLSGDRASEADALNWVGCYHSRLGFHEKALAYCYQALDLHRKFADLPYQVDTWDSLGYAHHQLGNHQEAIACYRRALTLWRDVDDRYEVATTLQRLGDVHAAADDADAARAAWRQARTILQELGHSTEDPSWSADHHSLDQTAGVRQPGNAYVDPGRFDAGDPLSMRPRPIGDVAASLEPSAVSNLKEY